jgi:uncharacterized protein (DUF2126 family)
MTKIIHVEIFRINMQGKNGIRMYGVLSESVDQVWSEVKPLLEEAIKRSADGKYEADDIYTAVKARDMQLWVAFDDKGLCAIEITQIVKYPRKKVLMLFFTAGRQAENWLHLIDELGLFAKEHGCTAIEGYGRPGWEKLSAPLGFKKIHTIFKLPLD